MSNNATIPILVALTIQLVLGVVVFLANSHRKSNQSFLLLSLVAAGWLGAIFFAFTATDSKQAEFWIRAAFAAAALILTALNLLRISLRWSHESWREILYRSRTWLGASLGVIIFCQTRWFLKGVQLSSGLAGPKAIYGPAVYAYEAIFVGATVLLIIGTRRDLKQTSGGERAELGFILVGGIAVLVLAVPFVLLLGLFFAPSQLSWFAPFRVVLFSLVVAYGIATRKIMEVGQLLRRAISYGLLTLYLLGLYALVWWLVATVFGSSLRGEAKSVAHVVAAVAIAFAMAPARGISQRLAERLFLTAHRLDFHTLMGKAADILKSVTTVRDLLERFAATTAEAMGTERVLIFMLDRGTYVQRYPGSESGGLTPQLGATDPVVRQVASNPEPLILEELHRVRQTPSVRLVIAQMKELNAAAILGIFSREGLAGIMLLGPRRSGRIYGSTEQSALQVLCGQLAVALENAQLFTEVQNAKIYNETLLHNLTTGVIAVGANEEVTLFNDEAAQLTGVTSEKVLERSIERLPAAICELLRETLRSGERIENRELTLFSDTGSVTVRASSSIFHSQDGEMLGALMVLTDITALKKLEFQIRRSDRLASLGTLSAGMAHEIKNPLVSIKTFAQLLPERYQDSDFRETFSNLIGHEIDRIDSLVNQLLTFARPAKPHLKPVHVHEIIETSLQLLGHRLYQKDIKLVRSVDAKVDTIRADADQLEQVFLNFFLNAMDAMKRGGELSVSTTIRTDEQWLATHAKKNGDSQEVLCITIRDNGEGIRSEDLVHVFDPFFTTKDYGTGLGLSVVHAIVQEHGGQIEVESELAKGTSFHILLPLVRFEGEEAAA